MVFKQKQRQFKQFKCVNNKQYFTWLNNKIKWKSNVVTQFKFNKF